MKVFLGFFTLLSLLSFALGSADKSSNDNFAVDEHIERYRKYISLSLKATSDIQNGSLLHINLNKDRDLVESFKRVSDRRSTAFKFGLKLFEFDPEMVELCVALWADNMKLNMCNRELTLFDHLTNLISINAVVNDVKQYYPEHLMAATSVRTAYMGLLERLKLPVPVDNLACNHLVDPKHPTMTMATVLIQIDVFTVLMQSCSEHWNRHAIEMIETFVVLKRPEVIETIILERWILYCGVERVRKFMKFLKLSWNIEKYSPLTDYKVGDDTTYANLLTHDFVFDSSSLDAMNKSFFFTPMPKRPSPLQRHPTPSQLELMDKFKLELYQKFLVPAENHPTILLISESATTEDVVLIGKAQMIDVRFGRELLPISFDSKYYDEHNEAVGSFQALRVSSLHAHSFTAYLGYVNNPKIVSSFEYAINYGPSLPSCLRKLLVKQPRYACALNYAASGNIYVYSKFRVVVERTQVNNEMSVQAESLDMIDGNCDSPTVVIRIGKFANDEGLLNAFKRFCNAHLFAQQFGRFRVEITFELAN